MFSETFNSAVGCFRGLAIGDALGAPVEFHHRGSFEPVVSYLPSPGFGLKAGEWTDDTIMAVCMADSMIEQNGYNSFFVMHSYSKWYRDGLNSPNGTCFDIGNQTRDSIDEFMRYPIMDDSSRTTSAGNGCIMRLAPAAIVSLNLSDESAKKLFEVSAIDTHNNSEAIETTVLFGFLLRGLMSGLGKTEAFKYAMSMSDNKNGIGDIVLSVDDDSVSNSGYAVTSFAAAWWAFTTTLSFREAVLKAVNLGGDSDTIAAITGQIAGAYYGDDKIDMDLKLGLYQNDRFDSMTKLLLKLMHGVTKVRYESSDVIDY